MSEFNPKTWSARHTVLLATMLAIGGWFFRAPVVDAFNTALRDQDQSHILLAPFVAVWLAWIRRSRFVFIQARPTLLGPLIVAVGILTSVTGLRLDIHTAWHAGPVIALIGILVSIAGLRPLRLFAPAFLALVFIIPVPGTLRQSVSLPLQAIAASISHGTLEAFGVQASRLGNVIVVNGEQIILAEACSGMRLVFSLTLVVFTFAFSVALRPGTRVLIILLSPFIALAANVVRLVPTSLLYGQVSADYATTFHDISGWAMLPLALLALVALLRLLRWLDFPVTTYRLAGS